MAVNNVVFFSSNDGSALIFHQTNPIFFFGFVVFGNKLSNGISHVNFCLVVVEILKRNLG